MISIPLAGIVAKGIGAVLAIFALGLVVGIILTATLAVRLKGGPRRRR